MNGALLVGTYAEPGLHLATRSAAGWRVERAVPGTRNVSFGAWSARHRKLYLVREDAEGAIDVIAPEDGWRHVGRFPSGGALPCHLALAQDESFLAAANYGTGDIAVFALHPNNGLPMPSPWRHRGRGNGPNPERQDRPHAHWVGFAPNGRRLLAADLGADRVRAFAFDGALPLGRARNALVAKPGSGPRWLAFADDRVLLVSELDSTLTLGDIKDFAVREVARCSTRPPGAAGENLGGHIAVTRDGKRAYVTNRGDDTIAVFAIAGQSLTLDFTVASGGASPRFLALIDDEQTLLVAHEQHGPVREFAVRGGGLEPAGEIAIEKAAWLAPGPLG